MVVLLVFSLHSSDIHVVVQVQAGHRDCLVIRAVRKLLQATSMEEKNTHRFVVGEIKLQLYIEKHVRICNCFTLTASIIIFLHNYYL